ncbi:MAG: energy transducer TonB [Acidobacteriaceae bacterium]|nr:energy transducer TonB [Acidobacteriaceae bacterium]
MTFTAAQCLHGRCFRCCVLAILSLTSLRVVSVAEDRRVQKRVPPVYPEVAKRIHVGGVVRILATVAPDGTVTDVKTINGNKLLSQAAEEAVKKWKFVAGDSESTVTIEVSFNTGN